MTAAGPAPSTAPSPGRVRGPTLRDRGVVRRDSLATTRWSVAGTAKIARDASVGQASFRGLVTVGGKLTAEALGGRGTLEVEGPIEVAGALRIAGTVRGASTLHAGDADVDGTLRLGGALRVDRNGSVRGLLETPSASAAFLTLSGGARVPGRLDAPTLFAELRDTSSFGPIFGRSVVIRGWVPNVVDKVFFRDTAITVERIEAEQVTLEGVDVEFVRAPQVVLGRDCHVARVEGTIVRQHPSSYVGPESRTAPPYGLRYGLRRW